MAQISLRIEDDVKKKAEQACADIGMSLSTARESVAQMEATGGTIHEVNFDD